MEPAAFTLVKKELTVDRLPLRGQMGVSEITGCSPHGASTVAGGQGERMPSEMVSWSPYQGHMWRVSL